MNSSNALIRQFLPAAILALGLQAPAFADTLTGRVVGVTDGDTLTLLDYSKAQHKIRVKGIDAPERGQDFGERSHQHLARLAYDKSVRAECPKVDRYKRKVCTVYVYGLDVGATQIEAGMAWWFREYAHEQTPEQRALYESLEERARATRAGLWSMKNPVPPWEWRRANNSKGNSR